MMSQAAAPEPARDAAGAIRCTFDDPPRSFPPPQPPPLAGHTFSPRPPRRKGFAMDPHDFLPLTPADDDPRSPPDGTISLPPRRPAPRDWWALVVAYNPFYLLSAVSMLLGLLTLSNTTTWNPVPLNRLLPLVATLELY